MTKLDALLRPRSIAVIGASPDPGRLGGRLYVTLKKRQFPGTLYPITPTHETVFDDATLPSILAVPETVDLALVIVRAELVLPVLVDCHEKGVRAAVIFSSGFAEAGGDHLDQQQEITEFAKRTGMLISGPNAEGFYNAAAKTAATFSPAVDFDAADDYATRHSIAVVAQSGGVGFSFLNRAMARCLGVGTVITTGNEAALDCLDYADSLLDDPDTDILLMFAEGLRDGRRLRAVAAKAAKLGKPIVMTKVGRSAAAERAAASHTASLAGDAQMFDAVAARYGIIVTHDAEEMIDVAAAFLQVPLPKGRRTAIVTTSGGSGVWLADGLSMAGLDVPELSEDVQAEIRPLMPFYGAAANPVDVTAQAARSGGLFTAVDILIAADEVDMVVVVGSLTSLAFVEFISAPVKRWAEAGVKPVLHYGYTLPPPECRQRLVDVGVVPFTTIAGLGRALAAVADYAAFRQRIAADPLPDLPPPQPPLPDMTDIVPEYRAAERLRRAGLPMVAGQLVRSRAEAEQAAAVMSGEMALKVQSADLPHKSDIGGVHLHLADAAQVGDAFDAMEKAIAAAAPETAIDGYLLQPMAPPGLEFVAGLQRDPIYGLMLMVGFGGIYVELFQDVAFSPLPVDAAEADRLLSRLKVSRLLEGFRGAPPADRKALVAALVALSDFGLQHAGRLAALDLNPVIVHEAGKGMSIVDAMLVEAPDIR